MIHPSAALIARADTPILECVELLRTHRVGSVLIVSDDASQRIIGIFTERDLLNHLPRLVAGNHWDRPVRTVMSRPVRTISIENLEDAPDLMIESGIRHLPVMVRDREGKENLAGMVSMRDFVRSWVFEKARPRRESRAPARIEVYSRTRPAVALLKGLLEVAHRTVVFDSLDEIRENGRPRPRLRVIDVDDFDPKDWSAALKVIHHDPGSPPTFLFYDPRVHGDRARMALEKLSDRFTVFAKPIRIPELLKALADSKLASGSLLMTSAGK